MIGRKGDGSLFFLIILGIRDFLTIIKADLFTRKNKEE